MDKYRCTMCGHIYDPAVGETKAFTTILCNSDRMEQVPCKIMSAEPIKAGTDFAAIPANWKCPTCGAAQVLLSQAGARHPCGNADDQLLKAGRFTHIFYRFFRLPSGFLSEDPKGNTYRNHCDKKKV